VTVNSVVSIQSRSRITEYKKIELEFPTFFETRQAVNECV